MDHTGSRRQCTCRSSSRGLQICCWNRQNNFWVLRTYSENKAKKKLRLTVNIVQKQVNIRNYTKLSSSIMIFQKHFDEQKPLLLVTCTLFIGLFCFRNHQSITNILTSARCFAFLFFLEIIHHQDRYQLFSLNMRFLFNFKCDAKNLLFRNNKGLLTFFNKWKNTP